MITENLSTLKIHKLTQAQYDRELANGTLDESALYLTPDEAVDLSGYATVEQLATKANSEHNHAITDVENLQSSLDSLIEEAKTYADEKVAYVNITMDSDGNCTADKTHAELKALYDAGNALMAVIDSTIYRLSVVTNEDESMMPLGNMITFSNDTFSNVDGQKTITFYSTGSIFYSEMNHLMSGASDLAGGAKGLVPAPAAGDHEKFLRGDGTWAEVSAGFDITDITEATESTAGLLSAADKIQLNYGGVPIVAASSDDGVTYTATVDGMSTLTTGMTLIIIPSVVSTSTATKLNVNSLGAKLLRRRVTNATKTTATGYNASWLSASKPVMVMYDGTYWIADVPKPSAADMTGTLTVSNGGTGKTTVTAGSFLVGNGTSAMTEKTPAEVLTALGLTAETWTFTLEDGSTVEKAVYVG